MGIPSENPSANNPAFAALASALGLAPRAVRQCATRCDIPDFNAPSNKQIAGWKTHIATSDLKSVQLVFPNWYMSGTNVETGPGGSATITASIEYPIGTFTQVTFGGAAQGTIADLSQLTSDLVVVSIPRRARFRVRFLYNNAAGIVFNNRIGPGDNIRYGASGLTDITMGGTPSGGTPATTQAYGPVAIIAYTTRPALFLSGDSRTAGQFGAANGDTQTDVFGGLGIFERSFSRGEAPYIVAQRAGDSFAAFNAGSALRQALAAYCDVVLSGYGINDAQEASMTAATMVARMNTYAALFGSKPVYQATLPPITTSADGWTSSTQTATTSNTPRLAFNGAVRTSLLSGTPITSLAGYVEVADEMETARDSGLWKFPGYTGDGVHGLALANENLRKSSALQFLQRL